ncbi:helix-turn-helix transcriptional regulator [Micromonospora sp. WMMD1102]|uniref:helix-turn-helix domain-containing protein n=1 Tax=Micromonospora sp. WMMD1102 TaxID=3016105 RepID=UPI0024156F01|nr:helix-turn-helix transcriptional regulator [Micromonospora sp. WMMD1102]MDG4792085.1 helix-turn-helix transcriptional regulator [Micromonospora sp. WMMD1102]
MDFDRIVLLADARKRVRDGKTARDIRVQAGVTMEDMAYALGVTQSTISRWEGGSRQPRGDAAIRWAQLLTELDRLNQSVAAA